MTKVAGAQNPADILTKYKGLRDLQDQLTRVNVQVVPRGDDRGGGASADKDDYSTVGGRAAENHAWSLGQTRWMKSSKRGRLDDDDV